MRKIDSIIIHCSATKAGQDFTAKDIDRWHRERGFNGIGYHYIVRLNGQIEKGRDIALPGAHCKGWNESSIGICYIGGLDSEGNPTDTLTSVQKRVMYQLIMDLQREYDILQILGHRDTSPDLNGDGIIEPSEYIKACPCFDVKEFMRTGRELLFFLLFPFVISIFFSGCRCGKEVINRNRIVEKDSSMSINYGRNLVEQSFVSEKDSEVIEEHVERMIFVFPVDTLEGKKGMMVKTVVDRRIGKGKVVIDGSKLEGRDSVQVKKTVKVENCDKMEAKIENRRGLEWWRLVMFIALGGAGGWLVFRWAKK